MTDTQRVAAAIEHLKAARDLLVEANCPRAAERVRKALTSAGGAQRNVRNKQFRASLPQQGQTP